jgi:hypothetical protein
MTGAAVTETGELQTDQQALAAAQSRMGEFAWPTVVLGVLVTAAYLATPVWVVQGWPT